MSVERHVSAETIHAGARLLRGTSQIFTGAADGLHHSHSAGEEIASAAPTESTPLAAADQQQQQQQRPRLVRQQTAQHMRQRLTPDEVQQRLQQDAVEWATRNAPFLIVCLIGLIILMITMAVFFIQAALGAAYNHQKPCDQPLKYYLLVSLIWSQVPGYIQRSVAGPNCSMWAQAALLLVLAIPGWFIIGWGFYMVHSVETCHKTNPGLFYPTRRYINLQALLAGMFLIISVFLALGIRRLMLYMTTLANGPGCAKAVHHLPKVTIGAAELFDPEDGKALGCPICMEPLADEKTAEDTKQRGFCCWGSKSPQTEDGPVKTPCQHYFHEDCLAKWCENHSECPLCRQIVGEPDGMEEP